MTPLERQIESESLEQLINTCEKLAKDCHSKSNALNSAPVTLASLAKETNAITEALTRLNDLDKNSATGVEDIRASNNDFIYAVAHEIHKLRVALKRIKVQDRDSGIDVNEPRLVIVWNEPLLKEALVRLQTHQASLHTFLNALLRSENSSQNYYARIRRVIEPDVDIDEALRSLGRHFVRPDQRNHVLPRVSDSAEIQVLLDTLVPPLNISYIKTREPAQKLHHAIDCDDDDAVFKLLLDRVDPNITLPGSMLSPLHRAFDRSNLLVAAFLAVAGADLEEPTNDGETAIIRAIKCGFSDQFLTLLFHLGAQVNAVDDEGRTVLHYAAASSIIEEEVIDILLAVGADLYLADYDGRIPLHDAVQAGHLIAAVKLLDAGADINARLLDGRTPLHLAVSTRNQELIQMLLSRGAKINRVGRDNTALTTAISLRCTAITAALVENGADINLASRNGNTPLFSAVVTGQEETVRYLLAEGADVDAKQSLSGYTAMHMAAHKNKAPILQLLHNEGAMVDPMDRVGETPLVVAVRLGNIESAISLINMGADVGRMDAEGLSILSHAVNCGDLGLIDALLDKGAGLALMGSDECAAIEAQMTPMHLAAQAGRDTIILRLVSRGAKVDGAVYPGRTPLHMAAANGHITTVHLLIRLGANVLARTTHGDTALFMASSNQATLKFLLKQGLDVNHANEHGATALHYAALRGHLAGVKLLLEKGAQQRHANAVWNNWEDRSNGEEYRQGTPAGIARQKGFIKLAEMIDGWRRH